MPLPRYGRYSTKMKKKNLFIKMYLYFVSKESYNFMDMLQKGNNSETYQHGIKHLYNFYMYINKNSSCFNNDRDQNNKTQSWPDIFSQEMLRKINVQDN